MAKTFKHPTTGATVITVVESWNDGYDQEVQVGVAPEGGYIFLFDGRVPKTHREWRYIAETLARELAIERAALGQYGPEVQVRPAHFPLPKLTQEAIAKELAEEHADDQPGLPL